MQKMPSTTPAIDPWFVNINYCFRLYQFFCKFTEEGGVLKPLKILELEFLPLECEKSSDMMCNLSGVNACLLTFVVVPTFGV